MRYVVSLIKKDFLLNKKMIIVLFLSAAVIPVVIQHKIAAYQFDALPFFIDVFLVLYILFGNVSMLDYKYKGAALLSTTPYKRNMIVCAGYAFLFVCFLICLAIYELTSLIRPLGMPRLGVVDVGGILLGVAAFFCIVIPLQYYFGYEKMKFITYVIVFLVPFCLPQVANWMEKSGIDFAYLTNLSSAAKGMLFYGSIAVISVVSIRISERIYATKDL